MHLDAHNPKWGQRESINVSSTVRSLQFATSASEWNAICCLFESLASRIRRNLSIGCLCSCVGSLRWNEEVQSSSDMGEQWQQCVAMVCTPLSLSPVHSPENPNPNPTDEETERLCVDRWRCSAHWFLCSFIHNSPSCLSLRPVEMFIRASPDILSHFLLLSAVAHSHT